MKSQADKDYSDDGLTADTDRILILGDNLLSLIEIDPAHPLSKMVLAFLDQILTEAHERALFNFSPRLNYDDTLRPFKTPFAFSLQEPDKN